MTVTCFFQLFFFNILLLGNDPNPIIPGLLYWKWPLVDRLLQPNRTQPPSLRGATHRGDLGCFWFLLNFLHLHRFDSTQPGILTKRRTKPRCCCSMCFLCVSFKDMRNAQVHITLSVYNSIFICDICLHFSWYFVYSHARIQPAISTLWGSNIDGISKRGSL